MSTLPIGMIIEGLVAVLLLITIAYCWMLNRRLQRLRADEEVLRATISELMTATEIAERAILGLKTTAAEADKVLGTRLKQAETMSGNLAEQVGEGERIFTRISQIAEAARAASSHQEAPPRGDAYAVRSPSEPPAYTPPAPQHAAYAAPEQPAVASRRPPMNRNASGPAGRRTSAVRRQRRPQDLSNSADGTVLLHEFETVAIVGGFRRARCLRLKLLGLTFRAGRQSSYRSMAQSRRKRPADAFPAGEEMTAEIADGAADVTNDLLTTRLGPEQPVLPDSLEIGGSAAERAVLESLGKRRETLQQQEGQLDLREKLLQATEERIQKRVDELKKLEQRIEAAVEEKKKQEEERSRRPRHHVRNDEAERCSADLRPAELFRSF